MKKETQRTHLPTQERKTGESVMYKYPYLYFV